MKNRNSADLAGCLVTVLLIWWLTVAWILYRWLVEG
jgi:hypothetical protein|nr:MAG TPA: hypothetical protein [Caudoviricetes sp.]